MDPTRIVLLELV